jgi:hypothetical protein
MELPKASSKNSQTNLNNKNNRLLQPRPAPERNFYVSPALNGLSEQSNMEFPYQNTLPRLFPERSSVTPNYYLHDKAALGQGFPPGINYYFDVEEGPAKLQRLEKENNTKADKASNIEVNQEQEKENSNVENESHVRRIIVFLLL